MAKRRVTSVMTAHSAAAISAGTGASTSIPPTKVSTDRPPRNPANTGQACPIIAAATPT